MTTKVDNVIQNTLNGVFTIRKQQADDASCYKACKMVVPLPIYFGNKKYVHVLFDEFIIQTHTKELIMEKIPPINSPCQAIIVEYGDEDFNVLYLSDPSAKDYVVEVESKPIGKLVDLLPLD